VFDGSTQQLANNDAIISQNLGIFLPEKIIPAKKENGS
jgi:hypothetical protein